MSAPAADGRRNNRGNAGVLDARYRQGVTFGDKPQGGQVYRLLITGSRELDDAELVWNPLFWILHKYEVFILIHGECPTGADHFAEQWYQNWEGRNATDDKYMALIERYPAKWNEYGKAAGLIRNQQMVDEGASACFAFPAPSSRGTYDCMARAWVKGIPVYVFSHLQVGRFHRLADTEGEALARKHLGWGS